jgi:hypothetical protein
VPFKTFLAAIEGFERHMPAQIDNSVWPTYSGAMRSQLLGAFKFLGLIDDKGNPTVVLRGLVENNGERKVLLRKIIETSYKPVVSAGLQHMTPKMFDDLMNAYGMSGDTQKKVSSFFLQAAKYAEIPMSPLLAKRRVGTAVRRRKANDEQDTEGDIFHVEPSTSSGNSRTVELKSGGKLTLILSVNMFDLIGEDRDFVFGIIDQCQKYESGKGKTAKS